MDITGAVVGLGPLGLLVGAFLLLLTILWLVVPFALFGLGRRIRDLQGELARTREALVAEQRRTNHLLGDRSSAAAAATPPGRSREEAPATASTYRPLVARRD